MLQSSPVYYLLRVGPGADPGVQEVSPQVTLSHPLGGILTLLSARHVVILSQPKNVTAHRPVPNYTAW